MKILNSTQETLTVFLHVNDGNVVDLSKNKKGHF